MVAGTVPTKSSASLAIGLTTDGGIDKEGNDGTVDDVDDVDDGNDAGGYDYCT